MSTLAMHTDVSGASPSAAHRSGCGFGTSDGFRARVWPRLALVLLSALSLLACKREQVRRDADAGLLEAQAAREAALAAAPNWSLSGRIAVSAGKDGGSGRIDWRQDGSDFDIVLSAPVSRQSWRLRRVGARTTLEGLEGGMREGDDAQALLYEATGWRIPVDALAAWARGARAAGPATVAFASDGLPALLQQQQWQVEYRQWAPAVGDAPPLPLKVFASRPDGRVRLMVDRWDGP